LSFRDFRQFPGTVLHIARTGPAFETTKAGSAAVVLEASTMEMK